MKNIVLASAVSLALFAGCSSPPVPVVPDGASRTPINNEHDVSVYQDAVKKELKSEQDQAIVAQRIDALTKQINDLKSYIALMQASDQAQGKKALPVLKTGRAPASLTPAQTLALNNSEFIEFGSQSAVFLVTHPYAKTAFQPSEPLQKLLLSAATDSRQIEIRGRTDSDHEDPADFRIARKRAFQARAWLMRRGVSPAKIHLEWMAAGGFITDNRSAEGKSMNRRVEIEARDLDVTALKAAAPKGV